MILAPSPLDAEVRKHYKLVAISTSPLWFLRRSTPRRSLAAKSRCITVAADPEVDLFVISVKVTHHMEVVKMVIAGVKTF